MSKTKKWIIAIVVIVVIIALIVGYNYWKKEQDKKDGKATTGTVDAATKGVVSVGEPQQQTATV